PLIEGHAYVAQKGETHWRNLYMCATHFDQSIGYQWCQAFQDWRCLGDRHVQRGTPLAHYLEDMFSYQEVRIRKHMTFEHGELAPFYPVGIRLDGLFVLCEGCPGVAD